jgi:hypothetical protein
VPDNVGYTPGTGATIAADDVGGALYQRVKLATGADGVVDGDVSAANPLPIAALGGELIEVLEATRMAVQSLTRTIGQTYPDAGGRQRVLLDAITASLTLATITTVTTVSTVTNQSQMGGIAANDQIPALLRMTADNLRRNITVT